MEFRAETRSRALLMALLWLAPLAASQEFRYEARHDHLRKGGTGALAIGTGGISFVEAAMNKHAWNWSWDDIQQLKIAPRSVTIVTYQDNPWKLGADREFRFDLLSGNADFRPAYEMLKSRLDQRFVAVLADGEVHPEWEMPVKHLTRLGGSLGVLEVGEDRIVYRTDRKGESRTWRFSDIENVSSAGPFDLTITSYERGFRFQLRQPLAEARYNRLWRAVNRAKGLQFLNSDQERKNTP